MKMFNRILVCLDGSKLSEQILPYAVEEAVRHDGELIFLHIITESVVFSLNIPGYAGMPLKTPGAEDRIREEGERAIEYMETLADKYRSGAGVNISCVTIRGTPGISIAEYAENENIDLITIATHGRSGIRRAVLGSVADYVLRNVNLPVLLITPAER
jgi:nucleotide-binding universal stress UspA family protein